MEMETYSVHPILRVNQWTFYFYIVGWDGKYWWTM